MIIGIPKEVLPGETRVALIPGVCAQLKKEGHEIMVEAGAGVLSSILDDEYTRAGATIVAEVQRLYREANVVFKVNPPIPRNGNPRHEAELLNEGSTYIGFFAPQMNKGVLESFLGRKITSYSMQYVPRITRAQSMDALSSMATISGYKAVLLAAERLPKMFPLLMTAAGTITPAVVLVLGAGVAGLQAIATAKRLGAKVEAFDPRPAVKEQVKSLGASFIDMEMPKDVETAGGYAKELSAEFLKNEQEAIAGRLPKVDVVICTAQVFGRPAPILITSEMVKLLHPGAVIVDLAAEQGGNCEQTQPGKTVETRGVTIIGAVNLPATIPVHASQMYARNIANLFLTVYPKGATTPNFEDEVTRGCCITKNGEIVNEQVKSLLKEKIND